MQKLAVSLLLVLSAWSCSGYDATTSTANGGASSGHVAASFSDAATQSDGAEGGLPLPAPDAWTPPLSCAWPISGDAVAGNDPFCDGTAGTGGSCPASAPIPGSSCTEPMQCAYWVDPPFGMALDTCKNGTWSEMTHDCAERCPGPDAGAAIPVGGECGQQPVSCGATNAASLNALALTQNVLSDLAACCGAGSEFLCTVDFEHGCATDVRVTFGHDAAGQCLAASLAGKTLDCAQHLDCASVVFTTLK
jgi:hypothetical protein